MKYTFEQINETLNLPAEKAAELLSCGRATINRYRSRYGLKGKKGAPKHRSILNYTCVCGEPFISEEPDRKYCSHRCYLKNRNYTISDTQREILSSKASERWKSPTAGMLLGIQKRKMSDEELKDFRRYRNRLKVLTEKTYTVYQDEINPNGYIRGVAGQEDAYHLDHIISARYGFDNDIPPEILARKENLQMLPWRDNIQKGMK